MRRALHCLMGLVEVSLPWGEHFLARPVAENPQLRKIKRAEQRQMVVFPHRVEKLEVHRHQQKPALHIPLSLRATSPVTYSSSSSAMFARITDRKNVGCLRTLESDLLRNTKNSFGTSRSVLDPSWFGLRRFPCVKDSYLHERSGIA